jgi:NAD(P)-dependent dehydrogenase (short-subunit alcohol dehydrogenase family)
MGAGRPGYHVTKAALDALTRTLADELRADGVLVNAISPGWTATDMGGSGGRPIAEGAASIVWGVTLPTTAQPAASSRMASRSPGDRRWWRWCLDPNEAANTSTGVSRLYSATGPSVASAWSRAHTYGRRYPSVPRGGIPSRWPAPPSAETRSRPHPEHTRLL